MWGVAIRSLSVYAGLLLKATFDPRFGGGKGGSHPDQQRAPSRQVNSQCNGLTWEQAALFQVQSEGGHVVRHGAPVRQEVT